MEEYKHFYQKRLGEEFRETLVPSAGQIQTEHQSPFKANNKSDDLGIAMFHQRGQSFATEDDFRYSDSKNHDIGHCTVLDKKVDDFVPQEASANNLLQRPPSFLFNTKENMSSKERNSVVSFSPRKMKTAVKPVTDNATNQRQSSLSLEEGPPSFNKDDRFSQSFGIGTLVEAQLEDEAKYQPGKIVRSHVDGSHDILFDDGERKLAVPRGRTRLRWEGECNNGLAGIKQNQNRTEVPSNQLCESREDDSLKIGSIVEVRKKSDGQFISGKIMRKRLDGTFDVLCSDGDKEYGEFGVPIEFIRSKTSRSQPAVIQSNPKSQKNDAGPKNSFTDKSKRTVTEMKLDVGTSIEARYRGKGKYYPGKVTRKRFDGTYDVLYSDGGREIGVPEEFIRFKVDERFEENGPKLHKTNDEYLTHDADTGWRQNEVGIRSTKFESHSDDVIEGKQKGKDKYHVDRGITRQRTYGSYDILCDDDREPNNGVRRDTARSNDEQAIEIGPSKPDNLDNVEDTDDFEVGTEIEAKLRGKDKYLPAKIARKRFDGSFDILYHNGSKEIGVRRDSIKKVQKSSKPDQEESRARNHEKGEIDYKVAVGLRVKVRSKDRGQILVGTIKSVNEDNSLDIQYDDGCIERLEKKDIIQNNDEEKREIMYPDIQADKFDDVPKEPSSKKLARSQTDYKESERASHRVLCVGDKVECRFRGAVNSRYYPGHIVSIHPDGTYDVDYDDGDKDRHLGAEHIRLLVEESHVDRVTNSAATKEGNAIIVMDGSTSNKIKDEDSPADSVEDILEDKSGRFIVGDKVECRFRGAVNSRYYPGHIVSIHPDGTYDVDYDDGDKDRHLGAEHIRLLVSKSSQDAITMMDGGGSKQLNKVKNIAQGMIQDSQADGVVDNSSTGYFSRNDCARSQTHNKKNERVSDRELCVGDKVECRFRGAVKSRYYPGHIVSKHPDGTYDVDYDDGDKDRHLGAEHIRLLVSSRKYDKQSQMNNTSQRVYFNVGDQVEAKVGRLGFIPGVISRVTSPCMYDISFHNGNHEFGVSVDDIRKSSSRKINDGEKNAGGQADGRENSKDGTICHGELISKLETKLIVIEQEISAVRRILSEMRVT